jgi:NAD+ synthase
LRDYVDKNGFPGVVLGLSGGIDSAISAAIAVDALGPIRVRCVMMPSPYTSEESLEDAADVAKLLGVSYETISIGPAMEAFGAMLGPAFEGTEQGVTEENIQSRSRGLTLMALSNKFGHMVLSTGNKSEMAVGYATLYGDMCGGYNAIKDIYKTTVFELCRWRNEHAPPDALGPAGAVMPERVIAKPPSAELRPDQKDEDSLPPYDVLDAMLERMIEGEQSLQEIIDAGFAEDTVRRIWRLLDISEYKRRQSPPGAKVSRKNFGRDRRYPLTNGYRRQI